LVSITSIKVGDAFFVIKIKVNHIVAGVYLFTNFNDKKWLICGVYRPPSMKDDKLRISQTLLTKHP
jgi:hypothetical protein